MKTKTLLRLRYLPILAVAFSGTPIGAQTTTNDDVLINGDNGTVNLKVTGNNGALFTGTFESGTIPATGAGTRMMWYPKKGAFRVGVAFAEEWDDTNIGSYSVAAGANVSASGAGAIAVGTDSYASGGNAVALGTGADASGSNSLAASGGSANENGAVAIGSGSVASGVYTTAIGVGAVAAGDFSVAIGTAITAPSFGCTVLGFASIADYGEDPNDFVPTDSLLIVGNGTDFEFTQSNALVMRKDANMRTGGKIEAKEGMRAKPLGDLSMGAFTAGDNPSTLDAALKYTGE